MHAYVFMRHRLSWVETVVRFQFIERYGWRKSSRRYGVIPSKLWGGRAVPPLTTFDIIRQRAHLFQQQQSWKGGWKRWKERLKINPGCVSTRLCSFSSSLSLTLISSFRWLCCELVPAVFHFWNLSQTGKTPSSFCIERQSLKSLVIPNNRSMKGHNYIHMPLLRLNLQCKIYV